MEDFDGFRHKTAAFWCACTRTTPPFSPLLFRQTLDEVRCRFWRGPHRNKAGLWNARKRTNVSCRAFRPLRKVLSDPLVVRTWEPPLFYRVWKKSIRFLSSNNPFRSSFSQEENGPANWRDGLSQTKGPSAYTLKGLCVQ
jgi:hypothetical protein